ncbi:uncharacterized protein VP01_64g10 [Puccinia sorghi]|uniref:Tet-like 2OG-Fe(II) oxygenase domain-containing protein n=1 Tax=Puccinia sorghi TaxID=27349 RepID=A0A0L6UFM5_9BASI|nr:uncharacterized protein VP01_64g10 [Puccinia sorghi]
MRRLLRLTSKRKGNLSTIPLPPTLQHDPCPDKTLTSCETLKLSQLLSHGTCVIPPLKNNQPHMAGVMWADGWRKSSTVAHLSEIIQLCQYNAEDKAASFRANNWINATHLQELAPRVLENTSHTLRPLDFHMDTDANTWTLVCWIPIFNPLTSTEDDPILADNGFDMMGGQFTFRDFQVYLDLNNVLGVTMCVFRSLDHTHQTLKGSSPSDRYNNRHGFSYQHTKQSSQDCQRPASPSFQC